MLNIVKKILVNILPYGFINWRHKRIIANQKAQQNFESKKTKECYHKKRYEKIKEIEKLKSSNYEKNKIILKGDDYQGVIDYLVSIGLALHHVTEGSVPEKSLKFISNIIFNNSKNKMNLLHIGNFVGVSLVYLAENAKKNNPDSLVIGIDPNIPHREVVNPQKIVLKLLNKCSLSTNVMIITSYSRLKSVSNDGVIYGKYDPAAAHEEEVSCEEAICNLCKITKPVFHAAFLDGNHEADYLEKEIMAILPLIASKGYIILDDVDENWSEIKSVFEKLPNLGLRSLRSDGRVGVAQLA